MTGTTIRWTLAAAALMLTACGGSQQPQQTAAAPAVAVKSPAPRAPAVLAPMTITFNTPTDPKVKADCQAALTGANDPKDPKNEKVINGDTVTWNLAKGDCAKYDPSKVDLSFNMHVFTQGNHLGSQNGTSIVGIVDDMAHTTNGRHKYEIDFDHKDAGDPDIDVNDCTTPPASPTGK